MSESRGTEWAWRAGLITITGLVGLSIVWQMFSLFMLYDDEGYVLHSLNEWARHGALYDQVFSQYGPLYFLVAGGAARWLGFEWTHDLSRIVTAFAWLATALGSGMLTTRLTGSRVAGIFGFIATSALLGKMAHEPMHPGNLLTPLIAWGAVGTATLWEQGKIKEFGITLAVLGTACAMVKINVGIFIFMAGGTWWWLNHHSEKMRRGPLLWLAMGSVLVLPALLMHRHISIGWGATFVFLSTVAIASAIWAAHRNAKPVISTATTLPAIGAGLLTVSIVIGMIMATGTSLNSLWRGLVIAPTQHADIYAFPPVWPAGIGTLTVVSILILIGVLQWSARDRIKDFIITGVRVALMISFVSWTFPLSSQTLSGVMAVLAGSIGWILVPIATSNPARIQARQWIGLLLVWQFLHAYPVAGSQLAWGTFLWVPLLLSAVTESVNQVLPQLSKRYRTLCRGAILVAALALIWNPLRASYYFYTHTTPLNLPGAQLLRVHPPAASSMRIVSANAALHGDMLYSIPGTFSYNLWTDLPTPTSQNVTHWFTLLDDSAQTAIIESLESSKRPAWIAQPGLLEAVLSEGAGSDSKLLHYWREDFARVLRIDDIELFLPKDQAATMINTATLYRAVEAPADDLGMIEISLLLPRASKIARVEVHTFVFNGVSHDAKFDWTAKNTTVESRQIHPQGIPVNGIGAQPIDWPLVGEGLTQFRFYPQGPRSHLPLSQWWLKIIDTEGMTVAEARFDTTPSPDRND